MKRKIVVVVTLVLAVAGISAGLSLATPSANVVNTEFGRRTVPHFRVSMDAGDIVVSEITVAPGGYSGWHSHPGRVVAAVQRGSITLYRSDDATCTGHTYTAGQIFIEYPSVMYYARDEGTTATAINATFFNVPTGESSRIDQAAPGNCPF